MTSESWHLSFDSDRYRGLFLILGQLLIRSLRTNRSFVRLCRQTSRRNETGAINLTVHRRVSRFERFRLSDRAEPSPTYHTPGKYYTLTSVRSTRHDRDSCTRPVSSFTAKYTGECYRVLRHESKILERCRIDKQLKRPFFCLCLSNEKC